MKAKTTPSTSIQKPEKVFKTIMKQINDVFSNKEIFDSSTFQKLLDKLLQWEHRIIPKDKESQQKCFETIAYILNNICNNTKIKKFYNTAPNISLTQYTQNIMSDQILNNIYHNNRQRFYKENIWWWNCHYRTVLFKKIFDTFQLQWLQIDSKIIAYKNTGWHSFLFITFQGKEYIADVWWIDMISKKTITPIDILDKNMQYNIKKQIKAYKQRDSKIILYDNVTSFAQYIDTKPVKNISIQFKPRLEDEDISSDIDIAINKKEIQIIINNNKYIVTIPESYTPPQRANSNQQIFEDILNKCKTDSITKFVYNKYIYNIAEKINQHKYKWLREIKQQ